MRTPAGILKVLGIAAGVGLALGAGHEAMAQSRVGVAGAVNPQSEFDRPSGVRTVVIGDNVLFKDRIITGGIGLVQVMFVDGSTFTVGPGARVVIDEFVYNPSTSSGSLVAEVTSGALRFVGGKLSKQGNTVRFNTPGGTLGVRGGIANFDLDPRCLEDGRCPTATASLVFGDELTLETTSGARRRIHTAGYSFVFFGDPSNPTVEVVPTSRLDQSALQARLTGRPGASGGSNRIPTAADVVASGVPAINSARAPITVLPQPKPIMVTSRYEPDPFAPGISNVTDILNETVVQGAQSDVERVTIAEALRNQPDNPDGPDAPDNPGVPVEGGISAFLTPVEFKTSDGRTVDQPGTVGIVTPFDLTQYGAALITDSSGKIIAMRVGKDDLPFPDELGETEIPPFQAKTIDVMARGTVYRGPDNFALYYLQQDLPGDAGTDRVLYLLTGEPTKQTKLLPNGGEITIRSYELSDDFQKRNRGIPSELRHLNPLVAREFGDALEAAAETPFYIAGRTGPIKNAQTLYGGLLIDGTGRNQRSAINVDAGFVAPEGESGLAVVGRRRGSYRLDAVDGAAVLSGSTGSYSAFGGKEFTTVYGKDANNFVYASGIEVRPQSEGEQNVFYDRQRSDGFLMRPDQLYSATTSVAELEYARQATTFARNNTRLTGFAGTLIEPTANGARSFRSTEVGDFVVEFDGSQSTLGGAITVRDLNNDDPVVRSLTLAFGTDIFGGEASVSRGTYIDDDTYGAVATGPTNGRGSPQTTLTTDTGKVIEHSKTTPGTYMISSTAVPQPQLFAASGVTECECRFLEWGWWGTATDFDDPSLSENVRDFAHLGTWVAGDVTPDAELPTVGTGSYAGHVVGNVVAPAEGGARSRYVAVGQLGLDYDFGARSGRLSVNNFDGKNFSGDVVGGRASDGVSNQFNGTLSGSGLRGSTSGAFARGPNGPAQGVLGSFDVRGGGYKAVGTYVGERARSAERGR